MGNKPYSELQAYYDDRAEEYDDVYLGKGTVIPQPELYKKDAVEIGKRNAESKSLMGVLAKASN